MEKAIGEVRRGLHSLDQDITRLLPVEMSQSIKMCEIAAEVLGNNRASGIAEKTAIENPPDFIPAGQNRAESRWIRKPKA